MPGSSVGQVVICSSCGVVQGALAEIDEYAEAIVAGRTDTERPAGLPGRRLTVSFEPASPAGGYRQGAGAEESLGELTIRLRYFGLRSVVPLLIALGAVGGLGYGWYLALLANSFWLSVPPTIIVALFVWFQLGAAFDSLHIRVGDGQLAVRTTRRWPKVEVSLACEPLQQLYVARVARSYTLFARAGDFKTTRLVQHISSPVLAWYLERQLETVLGLGDRSVAGEVSKAVPAPQAVSPWRAWAYQLLFVLPFVLAPILGLRACGAELAVIEVLDAPRQERLELSQPGRIYFTSEVDFVDATSRSSEDLRGSVALRIQILDGTAALIDLTCDPMVITAWVTNGSHGETTSFWGPMDDCSATLPRAGSFTLRAWREWAPAKPRLRLEQTILVARRADGLSFRD